MQLGGRTTSQALRSSTAHALRIAAQHGLKTVAFPAVGTGIAGFPLQECAEIMLGETQKHLAGQTPVEKVYFVLFDDAAKENFEKVANKMMDEPHGETSALASDRH